MVNSWKPGDPERRKMTTEDHDLLIEIRGDVKHMKEWSVNHTADDDRRHKDNSKKFDEVDNRILWLSRLAWGLIGVVVFVELLNKWR